MTTQLTEAGQKLTNADRLRIAACYHREKLPAGLADELLALADEWSDEVDTLTALAPKTSVPGNDAGMREALKRVVREITKDGGGDGALSTLIADAMLAGPLFPPTGSAGDDETWVREGYVLVPREATETMLKAAACQGVGSYSAHHAYRAMIAAAERTPQPPKAETPAVVGEPSEVLFKALRDPTYFQRQPASVVRRQAAFLLAALSHAPAARAGDGVERDLRKTLSAVLYDGLGRLRFTKDAPLSHVLGTRITVGDVDAALTAAPAANGEGA